MAEITWFYLVVFPANSTDFFMVIKVVQGQLEKRSSKVFRTQMRMTGT